MKSTLVGIWLVVAMLAAACSGDDASNADANAPAQGEASTLASSGGATTNSGGNDQPASVSDSGALQVVVFGLRNGTVLSMLDSPGGAEIGQISSGANDVYFTGEAQTDANGALLWQVEHVGTVGWVPPRFGYPATRQDVTEDVATAFGAASAAQDNAVDTALVVSGVFSLTSPPTGIVVSRIIATEANQGHVVIDVVDEGAVGVPGVLGYRVEVMTELDASGRYEITEVWSTPMCQNGAANGSCL